MILYNLVCSADHDFEAWFHDGAACDEQLSKGGVSCPVCGDALVRKAPMAPNIASGRKKEEASAAELKKALTLLRRHVESSADYVGERFAEEARRIHYGETEERPIYGEASREEATSLREEGIEAVVIPWLRNTDS